MLLKDEAARIGCGRGKRKTLKMDGHKLCDHLSEQLFRAIGGYFENFYSSLGRISEKIYSQQAVYLSYT